MFQSEGGWNLSSLLFFFLAIQGVLQAIQGKLATMGRVWAWGAAGVRAVGGGGVFGGV